MASFVPWSQIVKVGEEKRRALIRLRGQGHDTEVDDVSDASLLAASLTGSTMGSMRKMSFVGRLLGKNRKSAG